VTEQRTDEWFTDRLGKVTASRIADIMAKTKSGPSASRTNYIAQLVTERLTGTKADSFTSGAMQHGIDTEAQARAAYEFTTGRTVAEVGFVAHPTIAMAGASPDGEVGTDGLLEIKCPNSATHIATLLDGKVPQKYVYQMQFQMACTGRKWCDFVSFDPRLPPEMQLFIHRVNVDAEAITSIGAEVEAVLSEVDKTVSALRAKFPISEDF
jgi:putative phage-type endonuclease